MKNQKEHISFKLVIDRRYGIEIFKRISVVSISEFVITKETNTFEKLNQSLKVLRDWLKDKGDQPCYHDKCRSLLETVYNISKLDFTLVFNKYLV